MPNTVATQDKHPIAGSDSIDESVLRQAVDAGADGVVICDARHPEMPIIFANPAFARMTGYPAEEILGINCRFLQGDDTLQPEIDKLRRAIRQGSGCVVTLRNYRRDGEMFFNELTLSPIHNSDGELTHFIGVQKNVSRTIAAAQKLADRDKQIHSLKLELEGLTRADPLTGLLNRRAIEECLDWEWRRALRDGTVLNLYMIDIDQFRALNDRYGHAIGDSCLQRISGVLQESFGRASDFVGRYGGDEFVILNAGLSAEEAGTRGRYLLESIRAMPLPQPVARITLSIGLANYRPTPEIAMDSMRESAAACLRRMTNGGGDRIEQITTI